jgi:peptidoglycan/LPS O-acetylase OafA/YrhL
MSLGFRPVAAATRTSARRDHATLSALPDAGHGRLAYRPALDGLRALAVMAVIAYHDNYAWAKGGFLGVDLFFALSGFLITTLLVLEYRPASTIRLAAFWTRRARRLLPAVLLVLCFVAAYTRLAVVPWERVSVRDDGIASLLYVTNWRFIMDGQSYFHLFSAASPLRHMWSLAIEEQYYLVWPLVVLACLRLRRGSLRLLAYVCAAGALLSVISMAARFSPGDPTSAYYATDARAHTLLIGALLALLFIAWQPPARARAVLAALSVAALAVVLVAWHSASGTAAAYYRGGSAAFALVAVLVIAGALQPGPLSAILSVKPLVWIGRISYGLYLWHWPINVWLVPSRVALGPNALNVLRLAVTVVAAVVSYVLVERPIRASRFTPRVTAATFVPAAAAVAVIVLLAGTGAQPAPSYLVGVQASTLDAGTDGGGPPNFSWAIGDPLVCGIPRLTETVEARKAAASQPSLGLPPTARSERVLLVGDSTACSLWPGLDAVGQQEGVATYQGAVFGCGVATDEVTTTRDEAVTPNSNKCRALLDYVEPRALARARPTVVLWMSIWEKSDLVIDGRTIVAGTPEWETTIQSRMDSALARLTAGGARVVLVTEAAPAPNPAQGIEAFNRQADDEGYARLNDLLRRFAARHPENVTLFDLAERVCPGGAPCPSDVAGLEVRPDGRHFTPAAAVWAVRILLSDIFPR